MLKIGLGLVALWLVWVSVGVAFQRRFLYPGAYQERALDAEPPAGVERIWLPAEGGSVEAWLLAPPPAPGGAGGPGVPAAIGAAPGLVFFHGNGEFIDDVFEPLRPFAESFGIHLLAVEYPGFGRSTGTPSHGAVLAAAEAAWDALVARPGVDAGRIVVMGRSLGGGPAAELARMRGAAALILQSTFTDVGTMAARHSGIPPFLIRDRWQPLEAVRAYGGPVMVIHGRSDRIVSFRHGRALAAARNGTAGNSHGGGPEIRFLPLPCGHNDCPPPGEVWWREVVGFLRDAGVLVAGGG